MTLLMQCNTCGLTVKVRAIPQCYESHPDEDSQANTVEIIPINPDLRGWEERPSFNDGGEHVCRECIESRDGDLKAQLDVLGDEHKKQINSARRDWLASRKDINSGIKPR